LSSRRPPPLLVSPRNPGVQRGTPVFAPPVLLTKTSQSKLPITPILRETQRLPVYIELAMTKDNEQFAYITVIGDFDPETITSRIGLKPSRVWAKGDRNEKTHLERKFSRWSLDSRLERSASLEDHVKDVLEQTLPKAASSAYWEANMKYGCSLWAISIKPIQVLGLISSLSLGYPA
jgi:hypothetical protein